MTTNSLTIKTIHDAHERIAGEAVVTPLVRNTHLDDLTGGRIFLKCENLQRTGSFKFRGAYNALASMSAEERASGIVAVSSGNHAQGVAEAARLFDVPATIIMPHDAPDIKTARVKRSGGTVIGYDRYTQDRNELAAALVEKTGAMFVPPYDDFNVMAGQGTAGLEAADQLANAGAVPDIGLICCGGGGLCAGVSTAWRKAYPDMAIYAVEPDDFDDTKRSLAAGERVSNAPDVRSICDAIVTPTPGKHTFPVNVANGIQAVSVSDDEVLAAMGFALNELKMVVEPGGAVCLAALLAGKVDARGKTVVAVLSGGNADPTLLARAMNHAVAG